MHAVKQAIAGFVIVSAQSWLYFVIQYNVKAILDWKYNTNGDPMVDVGYFLMMFLQPAVYGYHDLAGLDLLMGKLQKAWVFTDSEYMLQSTHVYLPLSHTTTCKLSLKLCHTIASYIIMNSKFRN